MCLFVSVLVYFASWWCDEPRPSQLIFEVYLYGVLLNHSSWLKKGQTLTLYIMYVPGTCQKPINQLCLSVAVFHTLSWLTVSTLIRAIFLIGLFTFCYVEAVVAYLIRYLFFIFKTIRWPINIITLFGLWLISCISGNSTKSPSLYLIWKIPITPF